MLTDTYGRQFHYLRLSITEACNFRCQYCLPDGYNGPSQDTFITLPHIHTLLRAFAGLGTSKIRITGGEPSLRRDLTDILRMCKGQDGIERLAMTTHGGRLARHAFEWKDAGLDQVNISIDSLDPRQFAAITGQDKLKEVLKGLDTALEAQLDVKVNTVLMNDFSDARLDRFLAWLKTTPVTLRFIELMQTGDHGQFYASHRQSGEPLKARLLSDGWQPLIRRKDAGPAQEFYHPDFAGRIGLIMPYSKDFCQTCNRLRVAANGNLHLCLFSEQGISLNDYLQTGDYVGLQQFLQTTLVSKDVSHHLQDGNTGATRHLAMLGG